MRKTHLSWLLDQVKAGEDIIQAKKGRPCAGLVPLENPGQVALGFLQGEVGDEFLQPMSEEELRDWEGPAQ